MSCSGWYPTYLEQIFSRRMTLRLLNASHHHQYFKVGGQRKLVSEINSTFPGTSLCAALSSCGLDAEEDTEEELAKQVADLERELEEQDGMRLKLQEVFEAGTAGLVRQSGEAGHMEGLEESAVTPERKVEKWFPRWEINRHAEG